MDRKPFEIVPRISCGASADPKVDLVSDPKFRAKFDALMAVINQKFFVSTCESTKPAVAYYTINSYQTLVEGKIALNLAFNIVASFDNTIQEAWQKGLPELAESSRALLYPKEIAPAEALPIVDTLMKHLVNTSLTIQFPCFDLKAFDTFLDKLDRTTMRVLRSYPTDWISQIINRQQLQYLNNTLISCIHKAKNETRPDSDIAKRAKDYDEFLSSETLTGWNPEDIDCLARARQQDSVYLLKMIAPVTDLIKDMSPRKDQNGLS